MADFFPQRCFKQKTAFTMEFQTTADNGVMFYFSDKNNIDHISLVMSDGQIRFSFNSGTGPGVITSAEKYNDGNLHMLKLGRSLREGLMEIDGETVGVTNSKGRARSINGIPPFYFGGLDGARFNRRAVTNLGGIVEGFVGCINNIKINDRVIEEDPVTNNTIPCSGLTEIGAYFYGDGGYISLVDNFNVGLDLSITIEVRPRSLNGVLFSVHGKGDFVALQLVSGELWFTADNGAGSITSKFIPEMNNKLCDGAWHTIKASKFKNVVMLEVDDNEPITTTSSGTATSADTKNPIYIGGKPDEINKGIRAKGKYRGCIRNLEINGKKQYLTLGEPMGSVDLESCPAN